jgi:putative transposase
MSRPRQVLPGAYYLITRRCTQRQFLLRPDRTTNNAYLYCLIEAALRFQIDILIMCMMSNHHHLVIRDPFGRYPEFIEHLHRTIARSQNAFRGRWENFWASGQTSVVRLVGRKDILRKVAYVAANPVQANLVEHVHHWPGVNGYRSLLTRRLLVAARPGHFFRARGPMPASVSMQLGFPAELGDPDQLNRELEEMVCEIERNAKEKRSRTGARIVGRATIRKQSWNDKPSSIESRRQMSPRVAATNKWARIEALSRNREFVLAYTEMRARWLAGQETVFPAGTYWLRRFAGVSVADIAIALI